MAIEQELLGVSTCRCTDEVCLEDECPLCAALDSELGCPVADACECCDAEGNHRHGPLCEHPCCPDGDSDDEPVRTCQGCGCTDDYGCEVGCWWVAADLCSACGPRPVPGAQP